MLTVENKPCHFHGLFGTFGTFIPVVNYGGKLALNPSIILVKLIQLLCTGSC